MMTQTDITQAEMTQPEVSQASEPRRALILAGGGLKVAFQAGVLQVWLDEARTADGRPLAFQSADGASGGVFNLAMWCQGLSGREIADRWRRFRPLQGISLNWHHWLPAPSSVFDYEAFRSRVLRQDWALDWDKIRATSRPATFNLFNVDRQRHEVWTAAEMTEDALISAVSLPMWFPPVTLDRAAYIDAVYATDANLEAAIRGGADELWVIWTVSQRGVWRRGFVPQYFQIIEAAANSSLRAALERIERNNAADDGRAGEYGRRIEVKWLSAEVPAHYLFNFTQASMQEAVERGVTEARKWCRANGLSVQPCEPAPTAPGGSVTFREKMAGAFAFGSAAPAAETEFTNEFSLHLDISIPDVRSLVTDSRHAASVAGAVRCEAFGGNRELLAGTVELLTDDGDPYRKRMTYRLLFTDADDEQITLIGNKTVVHQAHLDDLWSDTSTLVTSLYRGDHRSAAPGGTRPDQHSLIGTGVLRLSKLSFARQLTTFRASAGEGGSRGGALFTFGQFFVRQLWQVYTHPTPVEVDPQSSPPHIPSTVSPQP